MRMQAPREFILDDNARQTLIALADLLIPGSKYMPSASQANVGEEWIDRAIAARPDWADDLIILLQRAQGKEYPGVLADLQRLKPASFTMLTELVAGAYFMNPVVRQLIGYPGQQAIPMADEEELQELLKPVIQRGPIYRPPPSLP